MSEYAKAFVVCGWSECRGFGEGLACQVAEGPHKIVDEAEVLTLAYALRHSEKVNKETPRRIVLAHSAAILAIHSAGIIVAMNGPEPTPLRKTLQGGIRVATEPNITPDREHTIAVDPMDGVYEVLKHPLTWRVPLRVRHFSTVQYLIDGKQVFPGGRVYLPTDKDEFGFGDANAVKRAREHGIVADLLPGWHNSPLLLPCEGAEQVKTALERLALSPGQD
jgi:hypothetical protein